MKHLFTKFDLFFGAILLFLVVVTAATWNVFAYLGSYAVGVGYGEGCFVLGWDVGFSGEAFHYGFDKSDELRGLLLPGMLEPYLFHFPFWLIGLAIVTLWWFLRRRRISKSAH